MHEQSLRLFRASSTDERQKSNFNPYIYTLFLDHFCELIVKIRYLCKIRGVEKLLNDVLDITLNSRHHDLTSVDCYVDQPRRLFIRDVA